MSTKPKFKLGTKVVVTRGYHNGRVGRVCEEASRPMYVTGVKFANGISESIPTENLRAIDSHYITCADQIRTGATYDLGGAQLTGQGDDEDHYSALRDAAGDIVLNHIELTRLFELGAVITEIGPPPEPDWQPGDWVDDANGRSFFYLPANPADPTPFKPYHPQEDDEFGWYSRSKMNGPLRLRYRHKAAS